MNTRPLEPRDVPHLERIYSQLGDSYGMPDFLSPEFQEVLVTVDADDVPVQMVAARRTVEIFHLIDKSRVGERESPRWRWQIFVSLHEEMKARLKAAGYTDVNAWLHEGIVPSWGFRKLVRHLGWQLSKRACFSREL